MEQFRRWNSLLKAVQAQGKAVNQEGQEDKPGKEAKEEWEREDENTL